jgi:hypothetical protein
MYTLLNSVSGETSELQLASLLVSIVGLEGVGLRFDSHRPHFTFFRELASPDCLRSERDQRVSGVLRSCLFPMKGSPPPSYFIQKQYLQVYLLPQKHSRTQQIVQVILQKQYLQVYLLPQKHSRTQQIVQVIL